MTEIDLVRTLPYKYTDPYTNFFVIASRKTNMVLAEGGQDEAPAASHGSLQLSLERQPDHYLRRLERIPGAVRRHIHRPKEGRRQTQLQHT